METRRRYVHLRCAGETQTDAKRRDHIHSIHSKEIDMQIQQLRTAVLATAIIALAGCSNVPMSSNGGITSTSSSYPAAGSVSSATGYGVVQAIDVVPAQQSSGGMGLGTAAGAVVGGVLGNQVGSGRGRTAATIAGAAGGALAGNSMERNARGGSSQVYRVAIRMDNGSMQTVTQESAPAVQVGDRVRLDNGAIVERFR